MKINPIYQQKLFLLYGILLFCALLGVSASSERENASPEENERTKNEMIRVVRDPYSNEYMIPSSAENERTKNEMIREIYDIYPNKYTKEVPMERLISDLTILQISKRYDEFKRVGSAIPARHLINLIRLNALMADTFEKTAEIANTDPRNPENVVVLTMEAMNWNFTRNIDRIISSDLANRPEEIKPYFEYCVYLFHPKRAGVLKKLAEIDPFISQREESDPQWETNDPSIFFPFDPIKDLLNIGTAQQLFYSVDENNGELTIYMLPFDRSQNLLPKSSSLRPEDYHKVLESKSIVFIFYYSTGAGMNEGPAKSTSVSFKRMYPDKTVHMQWSSASASRDVISLPSSAPASSTLPTMDTFKLEYTPKNIPKPPPTPSPTVSPTASPTSSRAPSPTASPTVSPTSSRASSPAQSRTSSINLSYDLYPIEEELQPKGSKRRAPSLQEEEEEPIPKRSKRRAPSPSEREEEEGPQPKRSKEGTSSLFEQKEHAEFDLSPHQDLLPRESTRTLFSKLKGVLSPFALITSLISLALLSVSGIFLNPISFIIIIPIILMSAALLQPRITYRESVFFQKMFALALLLLLALKGVELVRSPIPASLDVLIVYFALSALLAAHVVFSMLLRKRFGEVRNLYKVITMAVSVGLLLLFTAGMFFYPKVLQDISLNMTKYYVLTFLSAFIYFTSTIRSDPSLPHKKEKLYLKGTYLALTALSLAALLFALIYSPLSTKILSDAWEETPFKTFTTQ